MKILKGIRNLILGCMLVAVILVVMAVSSVMSLFRHTDDSSKLNSNNTAITETIEIEDEKSL